MVGGGLAMEGMEQRNHKKKRLAKSSQASPEHGLVKLQVADGRASSCIFVLVFCLLLAGTNLLCICICIFLYLYL